ncbi:Iron-containing alcohol dehydrogenase [Planctomycetales bacterium 10988]|nr:Iron-containing alcohol dehydrogenase [Planctomycetales bacterium 10988]
MQYDYFAPAHICFGAGRREELGRLAKSLGERVFIMNGSRTLAEQGLIDELTRYLNEAGVEAIFVGTISREPEVADVDEAARKLQSYQVKHDDLVVAVGGGAALDWGKATAAMVFNIEENSVLDFLEGVGKGFAMQKPPLPVIAMPTTGGTGSEATKNAVITSYDPPFKKSLRTEQMIPEIVLVDPELAVSLPPEITATSGMDAITQLIESYLSVFARPIPQALSIHGLRLASPVILNVYEHGNDLLGRSQMAQAALFSGMALANSGLGMAHGVAAALGCQAKIPHGLACATMLPIALKTNRPAREAEMATLGRVLYDHKDMKSDSAADALQEWVDALLEKMKLPRRLSELPLEKDLLPAIVAASRGNSMSGNPVQLSDEALLKVLEAAW